MTTIQDIAQELKAADEVIQTVGGILERASVSVVIEITNGTSQRITMHRQAHEHGAFSRGATAPQTIAPMQSVVVGSESSEGGFMTGAEGRLWYQLDGEGTHVYFHWDVPFMGGNECHIQVGGPNAGWYETFSIISGGSKKVSCKFVLTERAILGATDPDWITCSECKGLFNVLDQHESKCPGRLSWPDGPPVEVAPGQYLGGRPRFGDHQPAGHRLALSMGGLGPNREGGWRKCRRCKQLFWDGEDNKGACPKWEKPLRPHEAEPGGREYFLPYDTPPRPTQQNDWRWCEKCFVLFYLPHAADSDCAAGGRHRAHEWNYVLDRVP